MIGRTNVKEETREKGFSAASQQVRKIGSGGILYTNLSETAEIKAESWRRKLKDRY
jgi:hypothetical protein